ncbi:MAG: hypothetical protein QF393_10650, partial [Rhodospirillales bacterium]|nr:hypothetical protein [Rhodospirillales bacterium]
MLNDIPSALQKRIDAIEEAFEFMLAYAAQGRDREDESESGGIRTFLANAGQALDGLRAVAEDRISAIAKDDEDQWVAYLDIL